jgi:hypothetical protein
MNAPLVVSPNPIPASTFSFATAPGWLGHRAGRYRCRPFAARYTGQTRRCQRQPAVQELVTSDRDVTYGLNPLSDRAAVQLDQGVSTLRPPTWPSPAAERHTRRSPIEMLKL